MTFFRGSGDRHGRRGIFLLAVLAVLVMLATALVPVASISDGATSWSSTDSWKVVLHTETDKNNCEQLTVHLYKNGSEVTDLKSIAQDTAVSENAVYTSSAKNADGSRKNVGSWGFSDDGYGPFNSFYAAFDPSNSNRMVCHLDPYDLTKSVDGKTAVTIDGKEVKISDCNIMWCLPTVWWGTDSEGNLVMTNIRTDGMTAYAHTVDGTTYSYLAIGVYEASRKSVGNEDILMSRSNTNPMTTTQRAVFRDYANNQEVVTDGKDSGHAMLWNFYQYELYKYCTLAVIGSWDSQTVAGNGSYAKMNAGLLDSSGPYSGTRGSDYYQSAKVFIENAWGSCYDNVDGIVINGTSGYYIDTSSNPTDSITAGGNVTYVNVALPNCYAGYGTSPSKDERIWGMPTASGGSGTTGLYD